MPFISDIEVVEKKKIIKLRMLPIVDGGGGKNVIDIKERYLTYNKKDAGASLERNKIILFFIYQKSLL